MKKRMIWLIALLVSLLLSISAFASPPPVSLPPQTAGEVPVPAHTVPVVTNVQISGDAIAIDVSGTYDYGGVYVNAITPSGQVFIFQSLTIAGASLTGTITGLPADTMSWSLYSVSVYNNTTPSVGISFSYHPDGTLDYYTISDFPSAATYHYDNEGRLTCYSMGDMNVYYGQNGSLTQYTISTATEYQQYNGQYQIVSNQITDPATRTITYLRYDNGVLMSRFVINADNTQYWYDGQDVLRRSMIPDIGGGFTIRFYDDNGNLYSYGEQTSTGFAQYDAEGNLIRRVYPEGATSVYEMYSNGQLKSKMVSGHLPDGRSYYDVYENGVYTERIISEGDGDYHYDPDGNYTGKTVYNDELYQEFNAAGDLTEYQVYSNQQGGVILTYNHRRVLQSITYFDPYLNDIYRYDAKEKVWYLNEVPFDGPAPIDLASLKLEKEIVWYPNNTVCSFGPQFRDVNPDLTDKWYMFTPVDLSKDGTQTFELVGGSVYVLGQVNVTVSGDSVTVTYSTIKGKHGNIYTKSEYLNFFPDLAGVITVNPEELGEGFQFGQTISIQKDLGGDTNVLMFVRNVATFCNFVDKDTMLRRYYKNYPSRVKLRDAMLAMMD